jgi:hypothetical protein
MSSKHGELFTGDGRQTGRDSATSRPQTFDPRPLLFSVTLFLSAILLFWVQPLVGKMVLPLLGGTPAVWNTCMLFFQGMLLAGYAYVLALTRWLPARAQGVLHAALLIGAALSFPVAISEAGAGVAPSEGSPVWWLLKTLLLNVGLPFFTLSASAPLLQKWYSRTRAASASDPYFLYAASNAGSLLALLGFPLLLEPNWALRQQSRAWSLAYGALVLLVIACAAAAWRARSSEESAAQERTEPEGDGWRGASESDARGLSMRRRLRWALLAFVPSSLVLGVTTYITTDVASVPLLWVIPLSLYLLSFVLVFARRQLVSRSLTARLLPGAAVFLALVYLSGAAQPAWFLILFHLFFLFVAALVCHGQLADERPPPRHLAEFYLWLAVGGALGGLFNALLAPLLFNSVLEYPLVIVLASYLRPPFRRGGGSVLGLRLGGTFKTDEGEAAPDEPRADPLDVLLPLGLCALAALLALLVPHLELKPVERAAVALGLPLFLLNHFFAPRPLRFALGLGAIMLASALFAERPGETLRAERNFFGTLRVLGERGGAQTGEQAIVEHKLYHGSTLHGRQSTDPARACQPLSYYHREGPLGAVFDAFDAKPGAAQSGVAVVGLGAGTAAAYARAGQRWTFYEIDPAVVRLARDPKFFKYLSVCSAAPAEIVLGDARLKLRDAPAGGYGLIVLDAFSSDAVPAHLLTREALSLYLSKLAPGGLVVFHVSNRSLELERVVGALAADAGLVARVFADREYKPDTGKDPSTWVVVARATEDLGALDADARWQTLDERHYKLELWRDDFSNVVRVFKWL